MVAYGYLSYEWFLSTRNLNMYGTFPDVFLPLVDFSSNVIRSSGLSRSSTIISIPLFYLILIDKIKFFYLIPYARLVYLIPYLIFNLSLPALIILSAIIDINATHKPAIKPLPISAFVSPI